MKMKHFRELTAALLVAGLLLQSATAVAPEWWSAQGVFKAGAAADDYAALNQGQLKNFVRAAVEEMNAKLPGGAGEALNNLVVGWRANAGTADDYAAANVGQLKAMGKLVRARLEELNLSVPPLGTATTDDDDNYALANLGQAKTVFNFAIEGGDADGDGVMDAWEMEHFGTLGRDLSLDTDGDGVSDHDEWLAGTDPNDWRSRPGASEQGTVMLAVYTPVVR
ncbi:MAG TPA: sugar-binding protein [Verrucomicrobiales bacterium]|nr:sugar-binding protein [Verrucomicrobiales bacterium]